MTELLTGSIECYVEGNEVKYEFTIPPSKLEGLVADYTVAVNSALSLRINSTGPSHNEIIIISGDLLRNSTLFIEQD